MNPRSKLDVRPVLTLGFYETLTRLPGELNHGRTLGGLAHMLAHIFKA